MRLVDSIPDEYRKLLDTPVAIFGTGASGQAAAELMRKSGIPHVVYDEWVGDTGSVVHEFSKARAKKHQLVIHSPAFSLNHPWIKIAESAGCRVVSEIDFAQKMRTGPTIVVTGTNGKTTLQEFITFSLKRSGISAVAAGQNSYPLSRLAVHPELDGVTAVCEMGAAYAHPLKEFRFDALFWINFHEDHIEDADERRGLFESFIRLINLSPKAAVYLGSSVIETAGELGVSLPDHVETLTPEDFPDWELPDWSAFATTIHQPGLALFRKYWLRKGYSDSLLKSAAENFEVRAHRLHILTDIGKTIFWNDSNAGNFAATKAALSNFKDPVVWIGGGHYRGGNLDDFINHLKPTLKAAVITGDVRSKLIPVLKAHDIDFQEADDLRGAVESAFAMARGKSPVVFSPGFIAGEEYGDFIERGICYENAVLGLKHQRGSV